MQKLVVSTVGFFLLILLVEGNPRQTSSEDKLFDLKQAGLVGIEVYESLIEDLSEEFTIGGITISPSLVYIGTVLPENVIIHLIQNAFNFITSSIAWVALMVVTQGTTKRRKRRSIADYVAGPYVIDDKTETVLDSINVDGDTVAWVLRRFADTAEHYKRLNDEL
ncbi:uncharacterized protein LOC111708199 [Eurytemora carolleeae]|uniref:uncharacterized protein LOC111708199 n=1 Tax=Eurytemora carolleeae TaxID=1294199 RepID=UPI000C78E515|nr:uncharacterized protein LOC111708199 [Eurytemora carolleeae]XP_023337269.1 uncharacterized protein LOC111708199 [Eurytemora carolleeae]XP_023337270.1 uncharacterized protein LOC111708199 [Eurytemora carolleeae]|eukprot:XP_023337268.1 uncharacterized protein LOC111708199 [Eurytemora affinis]